ncbi:WcbI family polysaccharide biosynthesis putative acetyltransferase [Corynebacterium jeddahense]|uniref:Polysaccharide biosynthesis enzyme WcbI domain-containing protein n=1 Tax=Corynebacterium jeddahense TaxID=1414719 RepID=A0ABY7UL95_9CORY|nr:WcbI family polysaccharide biosynthesis putative acetyltransferase [Corynebacterium jeddahense]WCZ39488.1 hypothetical protein CJEDD_09515 [Corynebacterium jeddahense]
MSLLVVVGNCQAESTRKLLMSTGHFSGERIAPVHELEAPDMGWFLDLVARADVLVTQPIRDGYRGLPVGTGQLRALLRRGARHVVVPVLRFDGLMPYQAIIRDPDEPSLNPPVVPYHDLRTLCLAAGAAPAPAPSRDALRRAAAMSVEQIRVRERAHGTVVVSDYLERSPVWHTVNHPDNATLTAMAARVLQALGLPGEPVPPDYEMLGGLDAPVDPAAAAALGVDVAGRGEWRDRKAGPIDAAEIAAAQLEFYRQRPALVAHGLARHAERIAKLGLLP